MTEVDPQPWVLPSQDDPDVKRGSTVLGGPLGRRSAVGMGWWQPPAVVAAVAGAAYILGLVIRMPCVTAGFAGVSRYTHLCYSDIPVLYQLRGFADGYLPYLDVPTGGQPFEYPVLTGALAQLAAWLTPLFGGGGIGFYAANAVLLGILFLVTAVATGLTARRRVWDGMLVASAPAVVLTATINWDLLPAALVAVWLLLWSRRVVFWSGVALGLAIAAKFYPVVLIGPVLVLCWRAGRMPAFWRMLAGAVLAWLVANVPVAAVNFSGWSTFYSFSQERGQDFGSPWLALSIAGMGVPAGIVNSVAIVVFGVLCLGVAALIVFAPRRPRLAPMLFLVLAAFLLTNKVYSPQYVIWLIPLAVLARPRLRDLIVWQAGEIVYVVAIWLYLAGLEQPTKGLPAGWYAVAIWVHIGVTVWFAALLVRDAWWPGKDPVRHDDDDPAGGVLVDAPDTATVTRLAGGRAQHAARSVSAASGAGGAQ